MKNPSSPNELDITLLYLLFRFTMNLPIPTNGWGQAPPESHQNKTDVIEQIRFYYNKICQYDSLEMSIEDFNDYALDLIGVLV